MKKHTLTEQVLSRLFILHVLQEDTVSSGVLPAVRKERIISVSRQDMTGATGLLLRLLPAPRTEKRKGPVYAAATKQALFLADGKKLQDVQNTYLKSKNAGKITVFGGTGAVPDSLVKLIAKESI